MSGDFQVTGKNKSALFTLKLHRGDGMTLLAMNWKNGQPPDEFVGFAIEYKEPNGNRFYALKNRLSFPTPSGKVDSSILSTLRSPIQKFRWIHFPRNAELTGEFEYRVSPVFMNELSELSYGEPQEAAIELRRETYPGLLNIAFTRGFVSSQAFVDRYVTKNSGLSDLIPEKADEGLDFVPIHKEATEALTWMGFEARDAILKVLDDANTDKKAQVSVIAYDLNEPEIVSRLKSLGKRLKIIIDDSSSHGKANSAETKAASILSISAGKVNVKRQHMRTLQHQKTIIVDGPDIKIVVCGSTNFSWRGLYVQANNALILYGANAVQPFLAAFDNYWQYNTVKDFSKTNVTEWLDLGFSDFEGKVTFSPHSNQNMQLASIASDVENHTSSCLFYSLAFLYQTTGPIRDAIEKITLRDDIFVYGISDRKAGGGLDIQKPSGNISPVSSAALSKNIPEPFKSEPSGLVGAVGNRMHHKFIVIDFNKPSARVYLGSYNFSKPADKDNGENLILVHDRRIAVSYMIEALRIFDHYHFRVNQLEAKKAKKTLSLVPCPKISGTDPWWLEDYQDIRKIRDRELFA